MHVKRTLLVGLGAAASLGAVALAQPQTPVPAARTVVAQAKLPSVADQPMHFRAIGVALKSGETENIAGVTSVVYQMSGSSDVFVGGQTTTIAAGNGVYVPAGSPASITAKGGKSNTLVFQLAPQTGHAAEMGPGTVKEMFSSNDPLPGLKAGTYDMNLTRVTFPSGMPLNAPHHRTGGALYFVISGTGANVIAGTTYQRTPGTFIYEPFGLVHQWGNPGPEPLTFVTFNINQEGVPAVAQEAKPN